MTADSPQDKVWKRRSNSATKKHYLSKEILAAKKCLDGKTKSGIRYAIAWVTYLLIGSWLFIVMEENFPPTVVVKIETWNRFKELLTEGETVDELLKLRADLVKLCSHHSLNESFDGLISESQIPIGKNSPMNQTSVIKMPEEWIKEVESECKGSLSEEVAAPDLEKWSMVDAIHYTMTLVTTIGFGRIYPRSRLGRMFCIVYALVGVPLTCILMAKNSEMLSNRMLKLYESVRKRFRFNPETVLCVVTWMFLSVGFVVFMFLPSVAFVHLEGWTYENSLYFTFITLTTIGFGDLVAGYNYEAPYSDIYKIAIVIWIMLALGYWVLLLNFLQKAIKSNAKAIKRRFTTKKIAKQAEFLKQLMTKVKTETNGVAASPEEKLHMMAIMVESLSRKGSCIVPAPDGMLNPNGMAYHHSSAHSCSVSASDEESEDEISHEISEDDGEDACSSLMISKKCESPVKFEDLMDVNVCVKTETLPGFATLVSQSATDPTLDDRLKEPIESLGSGRREITLPLRDVIGLVLTVASLEEDQGLLSECEIPSEASSPVSGTSHPNRKESLPLLRNAFLSAKKGLSSPTKGNYIQRTLNHYLEGCEEKEDCEENIPPRVNSKHQALMV